MQDLKEKIENVNINTKIFFSSKGKRKKFWEDNSETREHISNLYNQYRINIQNIW